MSSWFFPWILMNFFTISCFPWYFLNHIVKKNMTIRWLSRNESENIIIKVTTNCLPLWIQHQYWRQNLIFSSLENVKTSALTLPHSPSSKVITYISSTGSPSISKSNYVPRTYKIIQHVVITVLIILPLMTKIIFYLYALILPLFLEYKNITITYLYWCNKIKSFTDLFFNLRK